MHKSAEYKNATKMHEKCNPIISFNPFLYRFIPVISE